MKKECQLKSLTHTYLLPKCFFLCLTSVEVLYIYLRIVSPYSDIAIRRKRGSEIVNLSSIWSLKRWNEICLSLYSRLQQSKSKLQAVIRFESLQKYPFWVGILILLFTCCCRRLLSRNILLYKIRVGYLPKRHTKTLIL